MKRVNLAFTGALVLTGFVAGFSLAGRMATASSATASAKAQQAVLQTETLLSSLRSAESAHRGFLLAGDEASLEPYQASTKEVSEETKQLKSILADSSKQLRRLGAIEPFIQHQLASWAKGIEIRKQEGFDPALAAFHVERGTMLMREIHESLTAMLNDEKAVLNERAMAAELASLRSSGGVLSGSLLIFALIVIVALKFNLDVRSRQRAEEELRRAHLKQEAHSQRMTESNRLKSEFLANMSHELRTPLNSILGFAELLEDGKIAPGSADYHQALQNISASGRHLLQLINDVLDLSKIEAGKLSFQPEAIHLEELVGEVTSVLKAAASDRKIDVKISVDSKIGRIVLDPACLKQVLYNYLSNALKFTGEGGRVELRIRPEGDRWFRIEVEDTGIGIAAEDIGRLFSAFRQLDGGIAKRHAGTGLGLSLTKRLVEAQRGLVGVTSTLGKGSTFFAILPREFAPVSSTVKPPNGVVLVA